MKLKNELQYVVSEMEKKEGLKSEIAKHIDFVIEEGKAKDVETRVSMDVLRFIVGTEKICQWYEQYQCHDKHIVTLAKKALKEFYGEVK